MKITATLGKIAITVVVIHATANADAEHNRLKA